MSLSVTEISEILKSGKPLPHGTFSKEDGYTLVCNAIEKDNLDHVKKLIAAGLDVNWHANHYESPLNHASSLNRYRIVEYLIAAGSSVKSKCGIPALLFSKGDTMRVKTTCVLLANGARMSPHPDGFSLRVERQFQRGVIQCRDVIVTLLGLKKRRRILGKLDRFLVSQVLAVEIWATRAQRSQTDENHVWQTWPQK